MAVPSVPYVTAGGRLLATYMNSIVDYLGYLLNPPGVQAYRTVAGTVPTATWSNAIGLDGEDFNRDGMHSASTNNSRIVFNTAGRYRVTGRLTFDINATGYRALEMRLNSSGVQTSGTFMTQDIQSAVNGQNTVLECTWTRVFGVGDYIEMFGYQNSGTTLAFITGIRRVSIEAVMEGTN